MHRLSPSPPGGAGNGKRYIVMDPFVYRDGAVVPRDVTRVVVHCSVRVLPPEVFEGCKKLEEVQLHEGLKEIGDRAFFGCVSLGRLRCPSTVIWIGTGAFAACRKLEEVQLREGLEVIGERAFVGCVSLRRLNCPSTVLRIGVYAFHGCKKLEEIQLNEGLKEIGDRAFYRCVSLRRLNCPSTVVCIGARAFVDCGSLSVVDLAGILKVERGAFTLGDDRIALETRIQIPSRAFLVQGGNYFNPNYTCLLVTDGSIAPTIGKFVLIAPGCLTVLPESNLMEVGNLIHAIVNNGEGTEEDRLARVRQEVREEVRGEVSAILGLAFWKAKSDEAERAGIDAVNDRREVTGGAQEAKKGCRREVEGKGKLIAQNVLPFLDGLWRNGSQGGP